LRARFCAAMLRSFSWFISRTSLARSGRALYLARWTAFRFRAASLRAVPRFSACSCARIWICCWRVHLARWRSAALVWFYCCLIATSNALAWFRMLAPALGGIRTAPSTLLCSSALPPFSSTRNLALLSPGDCNRRAAASQRYRALTYAAAAIFFAGLLVRAVVVWAWQARARRRRRGRRVARLTSACAGVPRALLGARTRASAGVSLRAAFAAQRTVTPCLALSPSSVSPPSAALRIVCYI